MKQKIDSGVKMRDVFLEIDTKTLSKPYYFGVIDLKTLKNVNNS
jgi:hypothetical protein